MRLTNKFGHFLNDREYQKGNIGDKKKKCQDQEFRFVKGHVMAIVDANGEDKEIR